MRKALFTPSPLVRACGVMAKRCNKHRAVVGSSPTRCKKSCQAIIPVNEEEVENRFIHRQLPSSLAAYSVLRHKGAPPAVSLDIVEERRRPTFASPTHKDSGQPEKAQAARHKWVIEKEPPAADSRSLRSRGGGGETREDREGQQLPRGWVRVTSTERKFRGTKTN